MPFSPISRGAMLSAALVCCAGLRAQHAQVELPAPGVDFFRDVRPILADHCFGCHGPDAAARKADLRLDTRAGALTRFEDGSQVVVPGDSHASLLFERITTDDAEERMPPEAEPLTARQIAVLKQWIDGGAVWPKHWAFAAPTRAELPAADPENAAWSRNPIDRFVHRVHQQNGRKPSAPAPSAVWLRRVTMDLTGLPPTPAEIAAFVADDTPASREQVVDRLLASPRYGERKAQIWLDLARYADTNGYFFDEPRSAWKWREWVINAFNDNLPYDRFVIDQLAGDMVDEPTFAQRVATGFNRNHPINSEGGEEEDEYRYMYVHDRTATTATTFLGLTVACAQCHDHKFDPISQKDYYRFFAFFNSIDEGGGYRQYEPTMAVPSAAEAPRVLELEAKLAGLKERLLAPDPGMDAGMRGWLSKTHERLAHPIAWQTLRPHAMMAQHGTLLETLEDGSVLAGGPTPVRDTYDLVFRPGTSKIQALRIEVLPDRSLPNGGSGRGDGGQFILSRLTVRVDSLAEAQDRPLVYFSGVEDDLSQSLPKYVDLMTPVPGRLRSAVLVDKKAGGEFGGWRIVGDEVRHEHAGVLLPEQPITLNDVSLLRVSLRHSGSPFKSLVGRFRLSFTTDERVRDLLLPVNARRWSSVGPFAAKNVREAHDAVVGPESSLADGVDLRARYAPPTSKGQKDRAKPLGWKLQPWVDRRPFRVEAAANASTFLRRELVAVRKHAAVLELKGADAVKIWLNGAEVFARDGLPAMPVPSPHTNGGPSPFEGGRRPERPSTTDAVRLTLKAGSNELLVKITNKDKRASVTASVTPVGDGVLTYEVVRAMQRANAADRELLRGYYRRNIDAAGRAIQADIVATTRELERMRITMPSTLVLAERATPRATHLFERGDFRHKREKVEPGVPSVLPQLDGQPQNRLGLAQWLVDPRNPLTARVQVNRVWQQFFGRGIVATPGDFGVRGTAPLHRELLDWLATEFVATGWDQKGLHKLIALSATYAQDATLPRDVGAADADPDNDYLARGPRKRLTAEMVRDLALSVSGLLVEQVGGPSVKPYQPPGLWTAMSVGQPYQRDKTAQQYRRALYIYWKRGSQYPSLMTFDASKRDVCVVQRERTTTPLQALVLLNDPVYVEASKMLGKRMCIEGGDADAQRIAHGFLLCTSRQPSARETKLLSDLLAAQRAHFADHPEEAKKLLGVGDAKVAESIEPAEAAAWATVASALLNLSETITRG